MIEGKAFFPDLGVLGVAEKCFQERGEDHPCDLADRGEEIATLRAFSFNFCDVRLVLKATAPKDFEDDGVLKALCDVSTFIEPRQT